MFNIRTTSINDASLILQFIYELAAYQKLEDQVTGTLEDIKNTLFCDNPQAYVLVIEVDNEPVGFILYHKSYSTFLCKYCLHIDDLYVREGYRGQGYGEALVKAVCDVAYEQGCGRVDWLVLDWNQPAIDFYKHIGATELGEWKVFRLNHDDIERLVIKNPKQLSSTSIIDCLGGRV
jgi:GNAT superfamily N-acetyltransferase